MGLIPPATIPLADVAWAEFEPLLVSFPPVELLWVSGESALPFAKVFEPPVDVPGAGLVLMPPLSEESDVGSEVKVGSEDESPRDAAGSGGEVLLSLSSELSDIEFSSHSFRSFCKLETC